MHGDTKQPRETNRPNCPRCENIPLRRASRRGFLQRNLYSWLGYFPWECSLCREQFLCKQRYTSTPETPLAAAPTTPMAAPAASATPTAREKVLAWQNTYTPAKKPEAPATTMLPEPRKFQPGVTP